jgi:hypothetical protein
MVTIEPMVMVHIRDDREIVLAFQEWCLRVRPQVLSAGRHGGSGGDFHVGYYSTEDEARIRAWFAWREKYCPKCNGTGDDVSRASGGRTEFSPSCPDCRGTGRRVRGTP